MNNQIQLFTNQIFGDVRSIIDDQGNPWFIGSDVAKCLGYSNTRDALSKHVDPRNKGVANCDTPGGTQQMNIINEAGLYDLIFSSKLPAAREFRYWVTSEILPMMRKIGFDNATLLLQQEVANLQAKNKDLQHQIDVFNALCENKLVEIHF